MPEGALVVFSAHGVAPSVHEEAAARSLRTIDATCPLVTKVHQEARRFAAEDYDILLIGHEGHEEVVGTTGEAPEHITLVDGPDDARRRRRPRPGEGRVAVADHAVGRRDHRDGRPRCASGSRCCSTRRATTSATRRRTARWRSRRSPRESDLVIVVGSANSSNSVRLVEVALEAGAAAVVPRRRRRRDRRGLARRASRRSVSRAARRCPRSSSHGVLDWLAERGYGDVEEVALGGGAPAVRAAARAAPRPQGGVGHEGGALLTDALLPRRP